MTRSIEPGKRRVKPQIKSPPELKLASARSGLQWTSLVGQLTGHPAAFAVVLVYAGLWFAFDRQHFDFNAVATLAVWIMTLLIQRANRRDTLALHAKLDELLRVDSDARSELTRLDEKEPEEIEIHRDAEVRKAGPEAPLSPE
jgi:low affinity Fe/Cu permease